MVITAGNGDGDGAVGDGAEADSDKAVRDELRAEMSLPVAPGFAALERGCGKISVTAKMCFEPATLMHTSKPGRTYHPTDTTTVRMTQQDKNRRRRGD